MKKIHDKTKKQIHYNPSNSCNLSCEYCFNSIPERKKKHQNIKNPGKIAAFFNKLNEPCTVVMCGGEPFNQKNFVELCRRIIDKHYIEIVTNLTYPLTDFFDLIPPERVINLSISLHIQERNRTNGLNSFINKVHSLERRGYPYQVSQVLHPSILKDYEDICFFMEKKGIKIYPKIFEGIFKEKIYPSSYTSEEKEKILNYINKTNTEFEDIRHAKDILLETPGDRLFSFTKKICTAGYDDAVIEPDGTIWRCWTNNDNESEPGYRNINHLGSLDEGISWHDKPLPCTFNNCYCPLMGFECTDKARKLGYR